MKTLKSLAILLLQVTSYYSPLKGGTSIGSNTIGNIVGTIKYKNMFMKIFFSNCVDSICYIRNITDESAVTAYQCYRKLCSSQCGHDYVWNETLA